MKYFPCTAAFGNFNCHSTAKAKDFFAGFCTYPRHTGSKDKEKQKQRPLTINIQMGRIFTINGLFVP